MNAILSTTTTNSLTLSKLKKANETETKPDAAKRDPKLWEVAKKFETTFISEMLKQAKIGDTSGPFSGGYGASTYSSFLVDEYAQAATKQRSFGLAETLYAQMRAKIGAGDGA